MKTLFTLLLLFLTTGYTLAEVVSSEENLKHYDVEIIIFEDAHARYLTSEKWQENIITEALPTAETEINEATKDSNNLISDNLSPNNQSVRISSWELCEEIKKTSLMQVHLLIKEAEVKVPYFPFMNIEIFNRSHREIYGPQPEFTGFYHDMFFSSMLLHLKAAGPYENLWLRKLDVVHDWVVETCNWLGEIAKRTAEIVIAGNIPNAAWLYSQFENIHVPRDIHHSPEGVYCRYFQWALIDISYDLQMLSENTKIEIDDLKTIVESKHFRKELWLDNFIDLRSETFLSDDALNWLCEREAKYLSQTVKQFNERYEDYMRIAQICTLQGQHMLSEQYSKLAVGDALAINHHKDSFLFGLSDIILNCAKAGIEETQGWLSKLGHFIDHVTECTDGDETDHVQLDFGEALLHIQPDKFSAFYKLYLDKEEWYHCDNLLSRFNKGADTSDPVYDAILETYVERNDRYDSSHDNVNDREKDQIDFSAFPPENLEKFLNKLDRQNLIFNKAYFHGWLDHWSAQQHQKPKILEAMKAVAAKDTFLPFRTGNYHNIMLQLTLDVLGKDAAYPILLQAQQENYGWSVHGTWKESEARFHMIAQNWPEKWLDFIKDTALPSKAYSKRGFSPSFGLSRLVQYLLILHKKDIVVEIGNMLTNFTLDRSKHMAFPASLWVEAFENCYGFIPLLFSRLDWPDVNIREEASQQIVILLKKDQYKNQIKEYYWQWLLTRVFESQCVTATVLFYKCRLENKNIFTDEDLEKLIMNLPAPSALSWMLLSEIKGEKFDPEPDYSTIHSGDTPHAYEIPDYFIDYKTALLPLIYDMRAEFLQRKGVIGFRRQWAYEITCLYERENIKARYPYAHYFINRGTQKRVSIFDLPQSEVFRSAYLRALAWAYDDGYIDKANMMFNVMSFCPVEFCSWQAKPIEGPNFWPRIHNTSQDIDQTPEQVFQSLENILLMDYSPDQVIGSASAPVSFHTNEHDGNIETFYDLSIYGLFQKNVESDGDINPKEIIKQLQKNKNIDVNRLTLNLEGPLPPVNVNEKLAVSGGTVFVPATLAIRAGPIAHWQNEQMYRGIDVGAPYLAKEQPILKPEENKLLLKIGDQILSETSYWSFQKLEYWPENCPPPLGVCTLVSKEDIVRFCDTQSVSFCWLVQLEFYYRKERSDEFSKKNFYKFYEFSNIILNQ